MNMSNDPAVAPPSDRWRRIAVVAFAALGLLASACQQEVDQEVLIIGDSIAVDGADDITKAFNSVGDTTNRYLPSFAAAGGQGLTYVGDAVTDVDAFWSAHIASLMELGQPTAVIVSLGVNDRSRTAGYGARIDNFMSSIPATVRVHWLTIPDPGRRLTGDDTINKALHAARDRWANLTLLPWASTGNAHPKWFDGVHHTAEGQAKYAEFLKTQLDRLYS